MSDKINTIECPYCKRNFCPHTPRDYDTVEDLKERIAELQAESKRLSDLIATIENDNGALPEWLWRRILEAKTGVKNG